MQLTIRRAGGFAALVAAAMALAFAAPAGANTTIPGLNGKIAYTTNADMSVPTPNTARGATKCTSVEFPIGTLLTDTDLGILLPFEELSCTAEIATVNPDGTGFSQVTNNAVQDDAPAWLPADGSNIAYQSLDNPADCLDSPATRGSLTFLSECTYHIWSTHPDGTSQLQLTGVAPDGLIQSMHPSYSPDGSRIAFEALNPSAFPSAAERTQSFPELQQLGHLGQTIYTMPAGGSSAGTPTRLLPDTEDGISGNTFVSDSQPAWSPDGTQIAFTRMTIADVTPPPPAGPGVPPSGTFEFTSAIYVAPASGGASHQIESTPTCTVDFGTLVVISGAALSGAPLSAANQAPSDAARGATTQVCEWDGAPAWSPDGAKIAVERMTFPGFFLTPLNGATRDSRLLAPLVEDSDIVTFSSTDGSGEVDLSKVTEPADCGGVKSAEQCALDQEPTWSPDGTKIAFFSDRDATGQFNATGCFEQQIAADCDDEIWTMQADGSSPFQVTNNDVNDINPDWQRIAPPTPPPPPPPPAAPAVAPKVGVAGVRRACVSKSFHVRFRVTTTSSSVKSVVVKLDGKRIKSTSKSSFTLSINGRKLRAGRHRLTITATDSNGKVTRTRKSFSVCKAAKPRRKAAPRFTG
jgi:Tol biopolymer transport system component